MRTTGILCIALMFPTAALAKTSEVEKYLLQKQPYSTLATGKDAAVVQRCLLDKLRTDLPSQLRETSQGPTIVAFEGRTGLAWIMGAVTITNRDGTVVLIPRSKHGRSAAQKCV